MPAEPKLSAPVKFFVQSMNSARLFAGVDGFTSSMRPAEVSWVIGVKLSTGW
jgi:hypothetical protein